MLDIVTHDWLVSAAPVLVNLELVQPILAGRDSQCRARFRTPGAGTAADYALAARAPAIPVAPLARSGRKSLFLDQCERNQRTSAESGRTITLSSLRTLRTSGKFFVILSRPS